MQLEILPKPLLMRNLNERMCILINHELMIIKKLLKYLPHNRTSLKHVYLKNRQQLYLLDLIAKNLGTNGKAAYLPTDRELKQKILPLAAYLLHFSPRINLEEHKNFIRSNPVLLYTLWQKMSRTPPQEDLTEQRRAVPSPHPEGNSETESSSECKAKFIVKPALIHTQRKTHLPHKAHKKLLPKNKRRKKPSLSLFWGIVSLVFIILFMSYFTFAAVKATASHLTPALLLEQPNHTAAGTPSEQKHYIPLAGETVAGLYLTEADINFQNKLVLTIDDIELNDNIDSILYTLAKYGIKAVFFIETSRLIDRNNRPYRQSQEFLHKILFYGHTIGNHSFGHPNYNKILNPKNIARNVKKTEEVIEAVLGFKYNLVYVRPPYGNRGPNNCLDAILKQNNQLLILWQIDSYDWKMNLGYDDNRHLSSQQVINKTLSKIKNSRGGVILLHGSHHINSVLEPLITKTLTLSNDRGGYTFVPLEELLALKYHQR
jgi:peptidoglycan/xylan/chitin deacetylase (PgdA/CDA1 family)